MNQNADARDQAEAGPGAATAPAQAAGGQAKAGSGPARHDGGPAADAKLDSPAGIYVDRKNGRLYIADTLNVVLRVVWE